MLSKRHSKIHQLCLSPKKRRIEKNIIFTLSFSMKELKIPVQENHSDYSVGNMDITKPHLASRSRQNFCGWTSPYSQEITPTYF